MTTDTDSATINPRHAQFTTDMEAAGYPVEEYHGRFSYHGPAVRLSDALELQGTMRATRVPLQWDQLGKRGLIVYPR